MALEVRRIVTGHDASGKAIVASDERLRASTLRRRAGIGRCEVWSSDGMPVDLSDAAAEKQKQGFVVRHNYVGSGQGTVVRVVEFAPGAPQVHAPNRDARLRHRAVRRVRSRTGRRRDAARQARRYSGTARHNACLGQ